MKYLLIGLAFLISGCINTTTYYLTPIEVSEAVGTVDKVLAQKISDLDGGVRQLRQEAMFIVNMGMIDEKDFLAIRVHVLAADYYVGKSWAALLEKNKDAEMLYNMGKDELKHASDAAMIAFDKKNST